MSSSINNIEFPKHKGYLSISKNKKSRRSTRQRVLNGMKILDITKCELPEEVLILDISNRGFSKVQENDLKFFWNVHKIDGDGNRLNLTHFWMFQNLRNVTLVGNKIKSISLRDLGEKWSKKKSLEGPKKFYSQKANRYNFKASYTTHSKLNKKTHPNSSVFSNNPKNSRKMKDSESKFSSIEQPLPKSQFSNPTFEKTNSGINFKKKSKEQECRKMYKNNTGLISKFYKKESKSAFQNELKKKPDQGNSSDIFKRNAIKEESKIRSSEESNFLNGNSEFQLKTFDSNKGIFQKLQFLNLGFNQIRDVSFVKNLPLLKNLDLSGNGFKSLPVSLVENEHLQNLNMSHNRLFMDEDLVHKILSISNIKILVLNSNKIKKFIFDDEGKDNYILKEISLQNNKLKSLQTIKWTSRLKNLKLLEISENPFIFDSDETKLYVNYCKENRNIRVNMLPKSNLPSIESKFIKSQNNNNRKWNHLRNQFNVPNISKTFMQNTSCLPYSSRLSIVNNSLSKQSRSIMGEMHSKQNGIFFKLILIKKL